MSELAWYFVSKNSLEIHLILYGMTREIFYPLPEGIVIHTPEFRFNENQRLLSTIKTLFFLRNKIKKIDPHSILSFGEYWNNFVLLSLIGLRYHVFVSDRSQPDKSLGRFHDFLRNWLYPKASGLILQTEKAREIYLSRNKHHNIAVIGNPINQIIGSKVQEEREKIVLMVGRLIKTKNQDKLLEMFASINNPDWKLLIVGYDHLKQQNMDRLKTLAKDLKIDDKVIFTGKQEDTNKLYAKSSIFAFTSISEGFPNVIGEAMVSGLPVIAFDCVAGPSEMITDGLNGYLIPLHDYHLFQERLGELMKNNELRRRLGDNGRESIKKFSSEIICENFYRFIMNH